MAEVKQKLLRNPKVARGKKYKSDGTAIRDKRTLDGPGVWVSCVKGREKQTVGELYDLFESLADELWPESSEFENTASTSANEELSLEAQIANEMSSMQKPPNERRFVSCQINTPCVVFISCKPPVDPVRLVVKYVDDVRRTGVTRTRYTYRFVPVSGNCTTNLPEIQSLCRKVFTSFVEQHPDRTFKYKIELRIRNHSTISRATLIQHIALCVPEGHTVSLTDPDIFILVEVFKSVCGISVVQDYYRLQKYNVMEISKAERLSDETEGTTSRIQNAIAK